MNVTNRLHNFSRLLILFLLISGRLAAEGTHELSPTPSDTAMLHTNANGFGNFASFASFGTASSLNIHINDFTTDSIYIGLSAEWDDLIGAFSNYSMRLLDPDGITVIPTTVIGVANANASTWALAYNGPDVNGAGGYSTNTATYSYSRYKPTKNGDYVIQFDDGSVGNIANILFYDVTVRSAGVPQPGRLWSRNWALRTPAVNGTVPPECLFDREFNGVFYSYTMDGFVSRIDFNNSGFQGLSFTVSFGDRGPGNTGDVVSDRRSVKNMNATVNNTEHKIFLNDPDNTAYPSDISQCGELTLIGVQCINPDSFCINIGVTKPGQVEIILDFNQNGIFDPNTTDVLLAMFFDAPDSLCIPWNGLKGNGSPLQFGEQVPTIIRYSQGVQHYAAFDVEFLKNGFCVQTIRPICAGIATDLLYWDDSQITDDVATVTINEGDPGTGQPKVQLNGCTCGMGGCRTWNNFQIGDPPTGTCVGTPYGYGENNTLNTWWFASTIVLDNIFLPFAQVDITGDSVICSNDSTVFSADVFPDTVNFLYTWTGPGGFMANTPTTGFITLAGLYSVTITDTVTNCTAIDEQLLVVNTPPVIQIDFFCLGPNQQNANVDLTVSGGLQPYIYLWNTGAMTQDLTNVPPGTYTVTVTDANGCTAVDSIEVEGCCELLLICPPLDGGTFACVDDVPVMNSDVVQVVSFCDDVTVSASQSDNAGGGCPGDPLIITRIFTVEDGTGTMQTCTQVYTVMDNVAPVLQSSAPDTAIICGDPITTDLLGLPVFADNCDGVTITFSDDSTGFNGTCTNDVIGIVLRTFYAEDNCGNIDSSFVQTISIIDTIPPTFVVPEDTTIDCDADISPSNTGNVVVTDDNCIGVMTTTFSDVVIQAECPISGIVVRTWTVSDVCGNSATGVQNITLLDTIPPTFTVPPMLTLDCGADIDPQFTGDVTDAADNCLSVTVDYSDLIVQDGCPVNDTVFRTWTVVDGCENVSTGVQIILRLDTTAPTFTTPADVVLDCGASTDTLFTGVPTNVLDNCSDVTISFEDEVVPGTCPGIDTTFRTWIVGDHCNNTSFDVQTIVRVDVLPPTITSCPSDVTIGCNDSTDPIVLGFPTAVDACDAELDYTFQDFPPAPGGCNNNNPAQRVWTVEDDCGNSSTCVQTILVIDADPPSFVVPDDVTLACDASTDPANTGQPSGVTDACSTPIVTFNDLVVTGDCTPYNDTIFRTWIVTDLCGNSATGVQSIFRLDTVPPTFTPPASVTISCDADSSPAATGMVTDTADNCTMITVDFDDEVLPGGCPNEDTIQRTWTATDECGNSSTAIQNIVRVDLAAPTFTVPADTIVDCGADTSPENLGDVTDAEDNCGMVTVDFSDITLSGECPVLYTITRTWQAIDECDNMSTAIQVITVQDTTAPAFTVPADLSFDCELDIDDLTLTGNVTNVMDCSAIADTTYSDAIGIDGCDGTAVILRTWTVSDFCNNATTAIQTITVQDTVSPDITIPDDITIQCDQNPLDTSITGGMVIILDNCSMMFAAGFTDDNSGLTGCNGTGTILRTWLVNDECDNAASMTQVITIVDDTPPVAICQNITVDFGGGTTVDITPEQIDNGSFDNCGPVTLSLSQTTFDCGDFIQTNSLPVVLTVTDVCGNTSTCEAQVMGQGGALAINCPADIVIYLGPGQCEAYVTYIVTADAICGGAPVLMQTDDSGLTSGDAFPIGVTQQCYSATNNSDTASCCFSVTVIEYDIPVVMACNDTVNVSVDNNCEAHIFADMILEGTQYGCYNDFIITIQNVGTDTGWIVFPAVDLLGGYYYVTITDPESGNSCWGVAHIEDKIPPQIICACPPGDPGGDTCQISCLAVDQLAAGNIPPELYPTVIENCGYTLEVTNIDVNDLGCGQGTVVVSWKATDLGGLSSTCDQQFNILPLSADSLIFPPNYIGPCGSSSDPDVTGWPQIGGYDLTDEAGLCNLFLGYWDKPLDDCGGGQKILRRWTVLDWCTLELVEHDQIIKLSDTEGPVLTCPNDFSVGTDFWYCHANVSIPKPQAHDNCSDIVQYTLISPDGIIVQYGNNFVVNGLELGPHYMTWIVDDLCGNKSSCSFTVTVVDDVVPVANCDQHTIVSLTNDGPYGITLVPASVFDDGSYDNCGPVTFRARRMDSCIDFDWTTEGSCVDDVPNGLVTSADRGTIHRPCVPFACCDVPRTGSLYQPIMVELEVTDQAGNRNYCMVEVEVQDKLSPFIECPPDIQVSCDFWFPAIEGTYRDAAGNANGHLDEDPLSLYFGDMWDAITYHDDQSVRQPIIIDDPANTHYNQPHNWGKDGWADDNCMVDLEVRTTIYNDCSGQSLPGNAPPGAIKLVERRFTARDGQGGISPAVCTQRIWVVDYSPFYISDRDCTNSDPLDGVRWPCDVVITNCPDDFNNTGEPTIFADACSLIGVTYEDTRFEFADGACYKILREWKVIDWCQYNPATGYGLWKYTQVIKVHDDTPPLFTACPQNPVTLCVADDGVRLPANNQAFLGENDPNASSCSVHVTMKQHIRETCNSQVFYDVKVYLNDGNSYLQVVPRTAVNLDDNHEGDLVFNTEESAIQSVRLNGLPYNSPWCGDYHKILWSVEDGCGNWAQCQYLFRLEDCKQPSPVCIQGLSTVVMPVNCEVTLWAKDFNASSFDDCTPSAELLYSFSGDAYEPSRVFNSTNIPAYGIELAIPIWVADGGTDLNCNGSISWDERNKDYCSTTIVFTDNTGNCDHSGSIVYQGEILTDHEAPVETVKVSLHKDNEVMSTMTTADNGKYVLVVPEIDGQRYNIVPKRLDQPRNGVSTIDLVQIQKHLLGKEYFTSPYQFIAADANNNQSVSAVDLVEIRKLILGIYIEYPNNTSWRFVDKNFQFADPTHPWPFAESINVQYDGTSLDNLDFVGVKVGDVNNTVKANATQILPRSGYRVINVDAGSDRKVKAGQSVDVQMTMPEALSGFQWTLETKGLEFTGVSGDNIHIGDQNVGLLQNGLVTMSWNEDNFDATEHQPAVFTIRFVARQDGQLSDMLSMSDRITPSEAYTLDEEMLNVHLAFANTAYAANFALYQNEPNPWTGSTTIEFDLPEAGHVELSLFDMTGKLVKQVDGEYAAGRQSVTLLRKDIPVQGVLYYRLESGNYSATKKMIRME